MAAFAPAAKFKGARPAPYQDAAAAQKGGKPEDSSRSVYVGNLSFKSKWQELKDHFKQIGEVENARVLTEDGTEWGRSRGVGIVRFKTEAEVELAIARLNGVELDGRALVVDPWTGSSGKWKEQQKKGGAAPLMLANQPATTVAAAAAASGQETRPGDWICPVCQDLQFARNTVCRNCGPSGKGKGGGAFMGGKGGGKGGGKRIEVTGEHLVYVGNLAYEVRWKDLKDHMKQAGTVEFCNVLTEDGTEYGKSKGVGCVRFSSDAEVQQAIAMLSESDLMGRKILVDRWTSNKK